MPTQWRHWKLREVALFVAIAAVVAVLGMVVGREIGNSGQAAATLEEVSTDASITEGTAATDVPDGVQKANPDASEPVAGKATNAEESAESQGTASDLTLSLSAPTLCETDHGFQGWRIAETPVKWKVVGGTGPFFLEIDGETRDATQMYAGETGTASVTCALQTGEVHYKDHRPTPYRQLKGDYVVDSGLKSIRATVTDAAGKTATTTATTYVILRDPSVLRRGKTYRVWGRLFTVPITYDLRTSGPVEYECSTNSTHRCEAEYGFAIVDSPIQARLYLYESDFTESRRFQVFPDGTVYNGRDQPSLALVDTNSSLLAESTRVNSAFDSLLSTLDNAPAHEQNHP